MESITVIIEHAETNYSAYLEGIDGIVAVGKTFDEIKQNIVQAINYMIEDCAEFGGEIPLRLQGEYRLVFRMDVQSFLQFYSKIFTKAGLERITGINQKQLWHYASGLKTPRPAQAVKIETALHKLGEELVSIQL